MKCPHCGAEIGVNAKFCESCGSQVSYEMKREQEQLNKQGCPKCNSSNIQFKRENQGEIRGKNGKQVIHRTVGFCKDCGYTWYPSTPYETKNTSNGNLIWWVLGWIFFFPAPVMVLIWRKKNTWDVKTKLIVTAVFWLVFLIIGAVGNRDTSKKEDSITAETAITIESDTNSTTDEVKENEIIESAEKPAEKNIVEDNAKEVPVEQSENKYAVESVTKYADDDIVNQFITDYNSISLYEMTDISKGNIKTKYFGYTNDCYIEMLNATNAATDSFCVSINGGNNAEATEKMFAVFPDFIHTLDTSITDEQIQQAIDDFRTNNVLSEGYRLGNSISITFVPNVELSKGTSSSRIDLESTSYGK